MRPIEQINDPQQLKQVALLLESENAKLHTRLRELARENALLRGEPDREAIQLEIEKLQAELVRTQKRLLGNPSERRPRGDTAAKEPAAKKPGHGPREQPKLRHAEPVVHELAADERSCPACDGEVDEWPEQFEESEEVTVVQRRFELVTHRRKKYRCRCNGAVVTAPGPRKLIPGGRYSTEFAVAVAVDKYLDHMPLERQVRSMERKGLDVSSQTLWDQLDALATPLEAVYEKLRRHVLAQPVLHADETWWRLMLRTPGKNWWTWCLTAPEAVVYQILPSRSKESARQALAGYDGIIVADAYAVYKSLAGDRDSFTLAHCWAHVRRKYTDLREFYPDACDEILDLIGELYAVERDAAEQGGSLAVRRQLRETRSRPCLERIRDWAYAQRGSPRSELRKAITYMLKIWQGLARFLQDPRIPLDNNPAERALRGPIVGRKNHYGSRSERGIAVAAILYSLLETAKLCRVDPEVYLRATTKAALETPARLLLPHELAPP